jgi:hypothetical protein
MVPQLDRQRKRGFPLSRFWLFLWVPVLCVVACSRRAEVEDLPDAGVGPVTQLPRPDGGVPSVADAGLAGASGQSCAERPRQPACGGANDFGCDLDNWLELLTEACQVQTDCHTDGWVEVELGETGCASDLRMQDPDPEYVACLRDQLSRYSCPCRSVVAARFLGLSNDGCDSCSTGELRCPPGTSCQEGRCVAD